MTQPTPAELRRARCRNHADREAVAYCRDCGHAYCRECVVEHEGRMVCRGCLHALLVREEPRGRFRFFRGVGAWGLAFGALVLGWGWFVWAGRVLLIVRELIYGEVGV